jgi:hypothetical protein
VRQYRICWETIYGGNGAGNWTDDNGHSDAWIKFSNENPEIKSTWAEWRDLNSWVNHLLSGDKSAQMSGEIQ